MVIVTHLVAALAGVLVGAVLAAIVIIRGTE